MVRDFDAAELIVILLVAILLFGDKLGGKSWQEMENELAQAIQRFRQRDPHSRMDSATLKDLMILGIVCIILSLEISWLATQI